MSTNTALDPLEEARRLSGLPYTKLSERAGISYIRVYRFFTKDGRLSLAEMARLRDVLGVREAVA